MKTLARNDKFKVDKRESKHRQRIKQRSYLTAASVVLLLILGNTQANSAAPDPLPPLTSSEQKEIVPAYFSPQTTNPDGSKSISSNWRRMCSVAKKGSIIILNPGDGPGTSGDFSRFQPAFALCKQRGYKVVGYIKTGYGLRSVAAVTADLSIYRSRYPTLDGIFFDQMDKHIEDKGYYQTLKTKVKQWASTKTVIGNVGNIDSNDNSWPLSAVDILVVQETTAASYKTWVQPSWVYPGSNRADAQRIAHIVHATPQSLRPGSAPEGETLTLSRARHAGYVYITNEIEGVPDHLWNALPSWWANRMSLFPDPIAPG